MKATEDHIEMLRRRIVPTHDHIVIRREEDVTVIPEHRLIVIPPALRKQYVIDTRTFVGTVLAVGPGWRTQMGELIKPSVDVGDRVVFGRYAGQDAELPGDLQAKKLDPDDPDSDVLIIKDGDIRFKILPD